MGRGAQDLVDADSDVVGGPVAETGNIWKYVGKE